MLTQYIILFTAGLGISSVAMFSGLGGGVFWMPLFLVSYNMPTREALIATLLIQSFGQASAFAANARRGLVEWKLVGIEALAGVPAAAFGVLLSTVINPSYIQLALGVIIFLVAYVFLAGDSLFNEGREGISTSSAVQGMPITFAGGVLTGLLGVGTGDWLVPFFNKKCGLSMSRSVASGIAIMLLLSVTAFTLQYNTGLKIDWPIVLPAIAGVLAGAQLGAWMLSRTPDVRFKEIFVLLLVFLGAHITFNSLP